VTDQHQLFIEKLTATVHFMIPAGVDTLLAAQGPFCQDVFAPGDEGRDYFLKAKVLVIGAGGLGCELLKSLALTGFRNIDVIDLDTIDISNLNRQFLFRQADVGRPKADVAAEFIRRRCPGINVTPFFGRIEAKDDEFYKQFNVVIAGLDSIDARNWISAELCKIARDTNGEYVIPYIDGGTEAWKGHVKVILPSQTACMMCQAALFPPPVQFQSCTLVSFPRQPAHCVVWAKEELWPELRPDEAVDGDNDEHVAWIHERAAARGAKFHIPEFTPAFTKGVIKGIIPAIASLQAIIAAMCATEALKLVTGVGPNIHNNLTFSADHGVSSTNFFFEKLKNCPVCSRKLQTIPAVPGETVKQLMERLARDFSFPATSLRSGETIIYLAIAAQTAPNLEKPITEFVGGDDQILAVAKGVTNPFEFVISGL
jgi:ubiquitin-activating enzyme E1 C